MLIVDPFCFRPTEIWPSTPPSEIGAVATVTTSGIQAWFARWEPERGTIDRRVSSARSSGTKAKESSWALLCMSKSVQRGRECRYGPPTPAKAQACKKACAFVCRTRLHLTSHYWGKIGPAWVSHSFEALWLAFGPPTAAGAPHATSHIPAWFARWEPELWHLR